MDTRKQCVVCHKLKINPDAIDHEFSDCPKRDFFLQELETKCSICILCGDYTRYDTKLDYACLGKCIGRQKRTDLTIDLRSKETGHIHVRNNKYMISKNKRYNLY